METFPQATVVTSSLGTGPKIMDSEKQLPFHPQYISFGLLFLKEIIAILDKIFHL